MNIKPTGALNFFSKAMTSAKSSISSKAQVFKDNFHHKTPKVTFAPSRDSFEKLDENIQKAKTAYLKGESFENVKNNATKNHAKAEKKLIKTQLQKMRGDINQDNLEGKEVQKIASQISNDALANAKGITKNANNIPKEDVDKSLGLLDRSIWEGSVVATAKRQMAQSHPTRKNKRALQYFENQKEKIKIVSKKAQEKLQAKK